VRSLHTKLEGAVMERLLEAERDELVTSVESH
jgi:hypothetical protein